MPIKEKPLIRISCAAAISVVLAGCQTAPSRVEQNFGNSVRHAIAMQTQPETQTGYGLDGEKAEIGLKRYREDAAEPEKVDEQSVQIRFSP